MFFLLAQYVASSLSSVSLSAHPPSASALQRTIVDAACWSKQCSAYPVET